MKRGRKWTKLELQKLQREHWGSAKPPKDKKLTPKQKVLKHFPGTVAVKSGSTWQVTIAGWTRFGATAPDAWWRASVSTPMRRFRRVDSGKVP